MVRIKDSINKLLPQEMLVVLTVLSRMYFADKFSSLNTKMTSDIMFEFWYHHVVVFVKWRLLLLSERTVHVIVIPTDEGRYSRHKMLYNIKERAVFKLLCSFYKQKHVDYEGQVIAYLMIQLITEAWQS